MILDIIITSLINGSTYALLAIGFSLIFGVARIVNIAHTAFYMVAAYCIYFVTYRLELHPVVGMLAGVMAATLLGLITYKIFIDPIREHEAAVLIATIALAIALQEIMLLIFSGDYLSVPPLVPGYFTIFGVKAFYQQLVTVAAALLILALLRALLMKTRLGLAIRATAQDREVANLMGMNERRVAMLTVGISVALAGFAGAVIIGYWGYRLYIAEKSAGLVFMGLAVIVLVGALATGGSWVRSVGEGYQLASLPAEAPAAEAAPAPKAKSPLVEPVEVAEIPLPAPVESATESPAAPVDVDPST